MTLIRYFGLDNDNHRWYFLGSFFDIDDAFANVNVDRYAMIKTVYELEIMMSEIKDIITLTEPVEDTW